jgi:predicted nuclease of predicted toxin-antitoxin system
VRSFKLDANVGARGAELLRRKGCDVATAAQEKLERASDLEVIAASAREGRALITLDKDFSNPLRYPPKDYAGVIVLRLPVRFDASDVEANLEALLLTLGQTDLRGRLIVVDHPGRVREYQPFEG